MVARLDHPTAAAEHNAASPPLKCPRCDSSNTKFCYYNNYSLAQPRHFCKSCKRYWTRGGTLRNVPVGGGCRKNKRGKKSHCSPPPTTAAASQSLPPPPPPDLNSFLYGFPPMINSSSTLFFPKFELDTSLATYEENFHSSLNAPAPVDFIGDYSLLNSRTDTSYDDLNIRAENNNGLNSFDGTNCLATSGAVAQSSYLYWPESGSSVAPLI